MLTTVDSMSNHIMMLSTTTSPIVILLLILEDIVSEKVGIKADSNICFLMGSDVRQNMGLFVLSLIPERKELLKLTCECVSSDTGIPADGGPG